MKNRIIAYVFGVFLVFGGLNSYAQQDPQFSQYMFNPLIINPAYAGSRESISTVILHRSQWVGFSGAPATQTLSSHMPLMHKKMGVGLSVLNDKIGPTGVTAIMGSYVYRIKVYKGKLGFGLRSGVYNFRYDWEKVEYKDQNDVYSSFTQSTQWRPSFDFGMHYNNKSMYGGLAFSHINRPVFGLDTGNDTLQYKSRLVGHLIMTGGYAVKINRNVIFRPMFLYKTAEFKNGIADVTASFLFNKVLWVGVTARTQYGFILITEYNISDNLRAGYSYDLTTTKMRNSNASSHEIFIGFDFDPYRSKILTPRYF